MHFEDIKAEIRKAGSSPAKIARQFEVKPATISLVLRGHSVSARIAKEISRITQRRVSELWPGKYPQLAMLEKAPQRSTAQLKAELQQLNARRSSRKAVAA